MPGLPASRSKLLTLEKYWSHRYNMPTIGKLDPRAGRDVVKVTPDEHPTLEQALAAVKAYKLLVQAALKAKNDAQTCADQAGEAAERKHDATAGNTATIAAGQASQHAKRATTAAAAIDVHVRFILSAANAYQEIAAEAESAKAEAKRADDAARTAKAAAHAAESFAEEARAHTLATREHVMMGIANRRRIDQGRNMRRAIAWLFGILLALLILCLLGLRLLAAIFPSENIPY